MIDPPEVFVLGPYMTNIDGKPGTVMPEMGVGAPAHTSSSVRPSAPATPSEHELRRLEARALDDAVDLVDAPVGGTQPGLGDRGDRFGDELDVGSREGGQEVGAEQDALAAERVVGPGACGAARGSGSCPRMNAAERNPASRPMVRGWRMASVRLSQ